MSRVGKKPIAIPSGVEVSVQGDKILFKGAKGQKDLDTHGRVKIEVRDGYLSFGCIDSQVQSKAYWGTYRALANNIVEGLSKGFTKVLEINGVGYRASISGKNLEMALGFSHPVVYPIPAGIEMNVDKNILTIKGIDKQQVGQIAAEIRKFRLPEPYKGKGIKYSDEVIMRKAGKTSKK